MRSSRIALLLSLTFFSSYGVPCLLNSSDSLFLPLKPGVSPFFLGFYRLTYRLPLFPSLFLSPMPARYLQASTRCLPSCLNVRKALRPLSGLCPWACIASDPKVRKPIFPPPPCYNQNTLLGQPSFLLLWETSNAFSSLLNFSHFVCSLSRTIMKTRSFFVSPPPISHPCRWPLP